MCRIRVVQNNRSGLFFLPFSANELYLIQRVKLFKNIECNAAKAIIILKTFLLFEKRIVFSASAFE